MKCYTVKGEEVRRGLEITKNAEGEPVLKVGSGEEPTQIPVGKGIREMFEARAEAILRIQESFKGPTQDSDAMRRLMIEVTGQDNLNFWDVGREWAHENPNVMILEKADLSTNEPNRIIRERVKTDTALVHVVVECSGQQEFYSNAYTEELVNCMHPYVRKDYDTFPSAGVGIACPGTGPKGETQGLFLMYPRSSFRIHRDEEPPVLVVAWPGSTLRCFAPAKYRPAKKQKRRRTSSAAA
jgi:hypothetical protein